MASKKPGREEAFRLQKESQTNERPVDYKSPMPVRQQAYVSQQPEQATPVKAVAQPAAGAPPKTKPL